MSESVEAPEPPQTKNVETIHRLPALSASQLLASQQSQRLRLRTGASALDRVFTTNEANLGLEAGSLVEVSGPPGSGKTTLAIQLSASAIAAGKDVIWIDTSYQVRLSRFHELLAKQKLQSDIEDALSSQLDLVFCPSLAHLASLFLRPGNGFPRKNTGLIVVDNVSVLFASAFPPTSEEGPRADKKKGNPQLRKFSVMTEIVKGMRKVASLNNVSIIIINQTTTKIISGVGAILQPAVVSPNWNISFAYRLFMYRKDSSRKIIFPPSEGQVRRVAILAANGKAYDEGDSPSIAIAITEDGIGDVQFEITSSAPSFTQPPILGKRKRTLGTVEEIPDSDEEEGEEGQELLDDFA